MKIATPIIALFLGVPGLALAQSEIRIPTDAELQRMERGGIATSPLGTSAGPKLKGSEEAQNLQMDRVTRLAPRLPIAAYRSGLTETGTGLYDHPVPMMDDPRARRPRRGPAPPDPHGL
jgi:hypothetical protein